MKYLIWFAMGLNVTMNLTNHVCNVVFQNVTYNHTMTMLSHSVLLGW